MAARADMDRIGLFSEMGYLLGDKYKSPLGVAFNQSASKGKQMLPGATKEKSAKQDGYFSESFNRVFNGEAYSDVVKMKRTDRNEASKKNLSKAWVPSAGEKKMCGSGSYHGTISGSFASFNPGTRPRPPYVPEKRSFTTRNPKRGTGYGYVDVCIGSPYKYASDPYNRANVISQKEWNEGKSRMKGSMFKLGMHPRDVFDENPFRVDRPLPPPKKLPGPPPPVAPFKPSHPGKESGGCKAGTFDPYPSHSNESYKYLHNVFRQSQKGEKVFVPSSGNKAYPVKSVVNQMVSKSINSTNFNRVEACY